MGQGDCTIMSTPDGKVILVDCGTNSQDGEKTEDYNPRVRDELTALPFLRNTMSIDIVILSHPDKDHYNRLDTMLPKGYTAHTVYHSGTIGHYHAGSKWARGRITDETLIKKVVLTEDQNKGESTLAGKPIEPAFGAEQLERLDGTNGLRIVIEDNCVITLLAASVATDYVGDDDTVDHRNRGSIVTLVELFDRTVTPTRTRKILLCADATRSTEHFVLGDVGRAARLTGVEIVQAGHHGSNRTSSGEPWVDQLKPTGYVIVSAGKVGVPNHHLPGWAVINRWVKRFEDSNRPNDATAHLVSGYDDKTEPASLVAMDVYQPVYATGSNGTRTFTIKVSP
jgi:beta-lactamase superfamily II metal-dependent hydrolase